MKEAGGWLHNSNLSKGFIVVKDLTACNHGFVDSRDRFDLAT